MFIEPLTRGALFILQDENVSRKKNKQNVFLPSTVDLLNKYFRAHSSAKIRRAWRRR